jgi:hypothetical protein
MTNKVWGTSQLNIDIFMSGSHRIWCVSGEQLPAVNTWVKLTEINYKYVLCRGSCFFGYTAENSHHLKSRITSKYLLFQEEKIPARKRGRCQVSLEKSSKNKFLCLGKSPPEGYPSHPPPHHVQIPRSLHVEKTWYQDADAESTRRIGMRRKGKGGETANLNPHKNGPLAPRCRMA